VAMAKETKIELTTDLNTDTAMFLEINFNKLILSKNLKGTKT